LNEDAGEEAGHEESVNKGVEQKESRAEWVKRLRRETSLTGVCSGGRGGAGQFLKRAAVLKLAS